MATEVRTMRRDGWGWRVLRAAALGWFVFAATPAAQAQLRAGAATADITPKKWPAPLIGQFGHRQAERAFDPLTARALVLDDGAARLALVVVDSCYVPRSLCDAAKRLANAKCGVATDRILISATHTHTAPPSKNTFLEQADPEYVAFMQQQIAEAISLAVKRLQPARIAWGGVQVPQHVFNRRWYMKPGGIAINPFGETDDQVRMNPPRASQLLDRPAGPTDPEVAFLAVQTSAGQPLAVLANYSLHYVGGIPGGGVSADYFGEFARALRQRMFPDGGAAAETFVGIMSNGSSGNINNINFRARVGASRRLSKCAWSPRM